MLAASPLALSHCCCVVAEGVHAWGGLSTAPSESECRPYIDKAIKELSPSQVSQGNKHCHSLLYRQSMQLSYPLFSQIGNKMKMLVLTNLKSIKRTKSINQISEKTNPNDMSSCKGRWGKNFDIKFWNIR